MIPNLPVQLARKQLTEFWEAVGASIMGQGVGK